MCVLGFRYKSRTSALSRSASTATPHVACSMAISTENHVHVVARKSTCTVVPIFLPCTTPVRVDLKLHYAHGSARGRENKQRLHQELHAQPT